MNVPFHKQLDPTKQAGQVVNPVPEQFLHQYIARKTEEPKKITFDEWIEKHEDASAESIWYAALKYGKIS